MVSHKIAYLCHAYPWITQTFIFNEINGLKANRVPLQVVAFKRPKDEDFAKLTPEMQALTREATYLPPPWSLVSLRSQLKMFFRRPWLYLLVFWQVLTGPYQRFSNFKLRLHAIQDFLRGVHLGVFLHLEKFTHVHAEFPNHSATSAWVAHRLTGISFSFRSYTSYNPQLMDQKIADAAFVLSCSEYDKNYLISLSGQSYADKLVVDVLGIDIDHWKQRENIEEKPGLILCVGTLAEKKGQEYLVRACRLLKDRGISFQTLLVGGGPDHRKLQQLIGMLHLQDYIQIIGYVPHDQVLKLMQQATVFCLPCVVAKNGDSDGIPFVLMEAMLFGKACVSTCVSGIPELIGHGRTGLLVEPRDPDALAESLLQLLKDPGLRAQVGIAARDQILKKFNLKQNVARTATHFTTIGVT